MKRSKVLSTLLLLSGLIAFGIGAALLLTPVSFQAASGIDLAGKVNLLSETRSAGGALAATGVLIAAGAFVTQLAWTSTLMASLMYLAYGLSRVVSMLMDGIPHDVLLQAAAAELVIGTAGVFAMVRYREGAKDYQCPVS